MKLRYLLLFVIPLPLILGFLGGAFTIGYWDYRYNNSKIAITDSFFKSAFQLENVHPIDSIIDSDTINPYIKNYKRARSKYLRNYGDLHCACDEDWWK